MSSKRQTQHSFTTGSAGGGDAWHVGGTGGGSATGACGCGTSRSDRLPRNGGRKDAASFSTAGCCPPPPHQHQASAAASASAFPPFTVLCNTCFVFHQASAVFVVLSFRRQLSFSPATKTAAGVLLHSSSVQLCCCTMKCG
jgi:hypothetical protein